MTVSKYHINKVVKAYMRNMKARIHCTETAEDLVLISEDGRRILLDRVGRKITERLSKPVPEE
jgi:hypothetical protein